MEINIIHQNVESIGNSVDQIGELTKENNAHVVCLSEHWKTADQLSNYGIENFVLLLQRREETWWFSYILQKRNTMEIIEENRKIFDF